MTHSPTFPVAETVETDSLSVACDGGGGALGHPLVYLHIKPENGPTVTCPYCSRIFRATDKALASGAGH